MIIIIASFLFISLLILLFWILKKLWSPIRVQFLMRSQGIQGPTYKFLHGNTKEIVEMRKDSITKSMNHLSHDIFPRILPHVFSWKNVYGANFLYCYGLQPELVVTEPQLLKEILSNRNNNFPKIDLEGFSKKLLGDGVSSSKGEKWTKMRILANHVFHGESLKSMVPMMIMSCETMLEKWKMHEEKEIEVFEEFRILTSEIISRTAFGSSYLEGKNIFQMLMKLALLVSRNAHKIRFPGIKVIDKSFGFDTAVEEAQRAINAAHVEAESMENGVGIVKLMGRYSGFIAMLATLGNRDVDCCLIPESPFFLEGPGGLYEYVEQRLKENGHVLIVLAEGAGQEYVAQSMQAFQEKDASGNRLLLDVGLWLTQHIKDHFTNIRKMTINMKYIDPTYMIRAIPSNASDNIYCTLLAQSAVHGAMAGFTGFTVGPVNSRHAYIPIDRVTETTNTVNLTGRMWARLLASTNQPSFIQHSQAERERVDRQTIDAIHNMIINST